MTKKLLTDHELLITELRKNMPECGKKNKDTVTGDFLTSIMEQHETTAWILRKYLN